MFQYFAGLNPLQFQSLLCWTINSKNIGTQHDYESYQSFNPCYVGQLIQSQINFENGQLHIQFQSLLCWTINSKGSIIHMTFDNGEFQSLLCWTINSKLIFLRIWCQAKKFQSLLCWTINSKINNK